MDLLVKNAKIVSPKKIFDGCLCVKNGKIDKLLFEGDDEINAEKVIDAKGKYVLPGLIEVHGHLREPGLTHKETYETGTKSAIAGGVTTIMDQPNTNPPTTSLKLVNKKKKNTKGRMFCDYVVMIHGAKDNLDEMEKLKKDDVVAVKVFMTGHETTPTTVTDYKKNLFEIAKICAKKNLPLLVHAEHHELVQKLTQKAKKEGKNDMKTWGEVRGPKVVIEAVKVLIEIVKKTKVKLYNLHTSTPEEFEMLYDARVKDNLPIVAEVVGYHLYWSMEELEKRKDLGTIMKVSPAIRDQKRVDELWKLLEDAMNQGENKIFSICSEHTPHAPEEKPFDDMWEAASGSVGIQENLPLLITQAKKRLGEEKLEDFLKLLSMLTSYNIANYFGLNQKGALMKGKDADFVIIDLEQEWEIKKEDLFTMHPQLSGYLGKKVVGRPVLTALRGKVVYEDGSVLKGAVGRLVEIA